ncbi:hypothetical protein OHA25_07335 [Nonomuraea sp. NBC_00507]|uniref:hypothetical protein n=1 Tax=Nonomuraea sp. NBC_00507 TaxID=2976002 RepID=UPI002E179DCC
MIKNLGDRLLAVMVPRTEASADQFTQWCGCWQTHHYYRTCWWEGPVGGSYSCGACYDSGIFC